MEPTLPPTETHAVASRWTELCTADKHHESMRELYVESARHVEAMEVPGSPSKRVIEGKPRSLR